MRVSGSREDVAEAIGERFNRPQIALHHGPVFVPDALHDPLGGIAAHAHPGDGARPEVVTSSSSTSCTRARSISFSRSSMICRTNWRLPSSPDRTSLKIRSYHFGL
jgi:hypothetical protein